MSSVKQHTPTMAMDEAFPEVDPGVIPLGTRVLVQLMRTTRKSRGGIMLVSETRDTEKWNIQVAKVIKLGPLAFKNRSTQETWPEGMWAEIGDFVRIPRWNGDRVEVPVEGEGEEPIVFVMFNDHDLTGKYTADPLEVRTYIL